jgi:hypothetical protein
MQSGGSQVGGAENITDKLNDFTNSGFLKHVTRFDSETKSELLNLIQYLVIVIVPIFVLNKMISNVIPDFDESKGNIELLGEVIAQSICLILGIYIIHRIVTYLPTFSGNNLAELNLMNVVLLITFFSMNSDTGKKVNQVYTRIMKSWNGEEEAVVVKNKDGSVVKVSQPIAGQKGMPNQMQPAQPTHEASRADYIGSHNQMLPPANNVVQQIHVAPEQQMGQQGGMNSNMYGGMGGGMGSEPAAANDGFGAFSSF